ncbi:MAG: DNA repair protein RadA [Peptococcaceae bacterium]|nr:DNA repair protein RadA [Peptococcaceae bacterium]
MSKAKTKFFCCECGQESARWLGRCPGCGEWNTLIEEQLTKTTSGIRIKGVPEATPLTQINSQEGQRIDTKSVELNRVLGGGVVAGAFILLSGEPGIGKSTLFLQMAESLSHSTEVLYVSGEESARQIKLRADRLNICSPHVHILAENSLNSVREAVLSRDYKILFIDSIQTMVLDELQSAPGSVSQIREGAAYLLSLAKEKEITVFLAGHVTKDGSIAGPRVLEHMVDTVLYFEGDQHHIFRLLRTVKNRFGPANEIGVFEMRNDGLKEVGNPSALFVGDGLQTAPGSAVAVTMEGTRPLLVEIQSLVTSSVYAPPRRTVNGMDYHRLLMLLAVLDKKTSCSFGAKDVFINIAGGLEVSEPAADLAVVAAIISGLKEKSLAGTAFIGELGLTGEVRGVSQIEQRLKEAEKFGYNHVFIPEVNFKRLGVKNNNIYAVHTIEQIIEIFD